MSEMGTVTVVYSQSRRYSIVP